MLVTVLVREIRSHLCPAGSSAPALPLPFPHILLFLSALLPRYTGDATNTAQTKTRGISWLSQLQFVCFGRLPRKVPRTDGGMSLRDGLNCETCPSGKIMIFTACVSGCRHTVLGLGLVQHSGSVCLGQTDRLP